MKTYRFRARTVSGTLYESDSSEYTEKEIQEISDMLRELKSLGTFTIVVNGTTKYFNPNNIECAWIESVQW